MSPSRSTRLKRYIEFARYCASVLELRKVVHAGNFPVFLYNQQLRDEEDQLAGLFRSEYFINVSHYDYPNWYEAGTPEYTRCIAMPPFADMRMMASPNSSSIVRLTRAAVQRVAERKSE